MNIKKIIKESLLNEIGTATAETYKWRLKEISEDYVTYQFRTKGGSNLIIEVNFLLIRPFNLNDIEELEHPYYYWDTEFIVLKHKDEEDEFWGDERSMTISSSQYKTDKSEIFKIMATLSAIVKDLMSIRKVRGFAFKPASESRGRLFLKYFENQLPNSDILKLEDGATIITVDDSVKYVKGEDSFYDWYESDEYTQIGDSDKWFYNDKTGEWERNDLLSKTRRKLGIK